MKRAIVLVFCLSLAQAVDRPTLEVKELSAQDYDSLQVLRDKVDEAQDAVTEARGELEDARQNLIRREIEVSNKYSPSTPKCGALDPNIRFDKRSTEERDSTEIDSDTDSGGIFLTNGANAMEVRELGRAYSGGYNGDNRDDDSDYSNG